MQQLGIAKLRGQERDHNGVIPWVRSGLGVFGAIERIKPLELPIVERDIFRRRQVTHRGDQAFQDWVDLIPAMLTRPVEEGAEADKILLPCPLCEPASIKGLRP